MKRPGLACDEHEQHQGRCVLQRANRDGFGLHAKTDTLRGYATPSRARCQNTRPISPFLSLQSPPPATLLSLTAACMNSEPRDLWAAGVRHM